MQQGMVLNNSYVLERRLGKNPFGETWSAQAGPSCSQAAPGTALVAKLLSLGEVADWKGMDMFEREISALKAMRHPAVPRYVDSFALDRDGEHLLVLVMEQIPGRSLAAELEGGRRFTESEIESMIAELLDLVAYLHALRPPIIHRDINPKNIMLKPDGQLALVDFSGVQDAVRLGSRDTATMVGTAGYTPHEQLMGRATPRSDLYAVAATAAYLLTNRHPPDIPQRGMKLDPGALVELSVPLSRVLDVYLEPDEALRTLTPARAAAILRRQDVSVPVVESGAGLDSSSGQPSATQLPADSKVQLRSQYDTLELRIPPAGLSSASGMFTLGFSAVWLGFVAFWTFMSVTMGAPVFFTLFSLPFWGVGIFMLRTLVKPMFTETTLNLSKADGLIVTERFLGKSRTRRFPLGDVGGCVVTKSTVSTNGRAEQELALEAGTTTLRFGRLLSDREKAAIAHTLNAWTEARR